MANLLVVEDDPGLREAIHTFFEDQGHHAWAASGVAEAVEAVKLHPPDLIVSDLVMGDGTGLMLRQQIKSLGLAQDPYFILVTGHPTHENAAQAFKGGADLYLTKPFQLPALALAVNNGLMRAAAKEGQRVPLASAEAFYHDFFLTLNPALPRLLMMLHGRFGELNPAQSGGVRAVFAIWRSLAWSMADFYQRLLDKPRGSLRQRWHGPAALERLVERMEGELEPLRLNLELIRPSGLPMANVHAATAEALMETLMLRLAAFSAPGAHLTLRWEQAPALAGQAPRLRLSLASDLGHPDLPEEMRRLVALLPPLLPLLAASGVKVFCDNSLGPWTLDFEVGR